MYDKLIEKIKKQCLCMYSYDIFLMRDIVSTFIGVNRIYPDTTEWFYLVDKLWCELDYIRTQFDSIEEFECELRDGL